MEKPSIPVSFEFFPPRNAEQEQALRKTWKELSRLSPRYLTVTFGAGGSAQDATLRTVRSLLRQAAVPVAPHISCMAHSRAMLLDLLGSYHEQGVERLVVLRGDRPGGEALDRPFQYANQLVAFVHERFPGCFKVEVACYPDIHPESESMASEIHYFRQKVDAGADAAITQYFFDRDTYFRFVDRCRSAGISIPITPGIMPITNFRQLTAFSEKCGARIPARLSRKLASFEDDLVALRDYGMDVVSELCQRLLDGGAPGLHFYTLNRANATTGLLERLGVYSSP